jgi:hypothetical protein
MGPTSDYTRRRNAIVPMIEVEDTAHREPSPGKESSYAIILNSAVRPTAVPYQGTAYPNRASTSPACRFHSSMRTSINECSSSGGRSSARESAS